MRAARRAQIDLLQAARRARGRGRWGPDRRRRRGGFRKSGGRCGARRIKRALAKRKIAVSRGRIGAIMKSRNLASRCTKAKFRPRPGRPDEAEPPDVLSRELGGRPPRTHMASGLAHVRVLGAWCCVRPLIDLRSREVVGHAAGAKKDADLVKAAFAAVAFPLFDIDVFHGDRGPGLDSAALDGPFEVFGIARPPSKEGCPLDDAADESTNKTLRAEFVYREQFDSLHDLQVRLSDYAWWYSNEGMHSTLGYMSPVEFRKAGLGL